MQANELRIGNLARVRSNITGSLSYETCITHLHISEIENDELSCEGIPLTEEWLLKFGFEKILKGGFHSGHYGIAVRSVYKNFIYHTQYPPPHSDDSFWWNTTIYFNEQTVYVLDGMKYVHQLQNLYFALTGEELKLQEQLANA